MSSSARTTTRRRPPASVGRQLRRRYADANNSSSFSAQLVIGNDDLLKQILIRLPAKPLFRFKLVSTRWYNLISDPYVLLDWKPPKSASSFFLRRYSSPSSKVIKFNYLSLNDSGKKSSNALRSLNFVHDPYGIKISQSCNGLLLCSSSCFSLDYVDTRYYVVNPTTKKFCTIPRPDIGDDRNFLVSMNLAFDPSVSLHYKLFAVRSEKWRGPDCRISIYSSETRTWAFSVESLSYEAGIVFENGVFFNGKIHWPRCCSDKSAYYDFSQDRLMPLPMPHDQLTRELLYFGESGGHLQLIEFCNNCTRHFDVFEMESDYSKWFVKYHVDLELGLSAFPEMHRMYPGRSFKTYVFDVLCFLGGEVEGDSCLVLYIPGKIISYNFKDKSFSKVCNLELRPSDINNVRVCPWFTIHPFTETMFHV